MVLELIFFLGTDGNKYWRKVVMRRAMGVLDTY